MKKWLIIEICLLVVVLAAAAAICIWPTVGTSAPVLDVQAPDTTPQTTGETTEGITQPTWMSFPEDRVLTAQQAFVYDCGSESFAYLKGGEKDKVYPASITKLFTAYVALQFLQPDTRITAGDALALVGVGSSVAEIQQGDVLTVEMLVEAMLLPSGNDASYLLAAAAGRVIKDDESLPAEAAVAAFVGEMNGQARALGMTGTRFLNPDGYHEYDHYTTYADLVTIGKLAMENPTIMKYAKLSGDQVSLTSGQRQWKNTNALVDPASPYYCPYAIGLKTGQTPSAGSCLLSAFEIEGRRYLIGVFGCPEIEDRFADTLQLLNQTLE